MMTAEEFVKMLGKQDAVGAFRFGSISSIYATGDPAIQFDGETIESGKTYKCLDCYHPKAGDRVLLARVGGSYVVLGKFGGTNTLLPAATGTMTATMDGQVKSITPVGSCTFNATGGRHGERCSFVITSSATSYTMTFGTNFKSAGTLATGTVAGKVFTVSFIHNGFLWIETGRTVAM